MKIILGLFFTYLFSISPLFAQVKKDRKSEEAFTKATILFEEQNYSQAYRLFHQITERPFNRLTTAGYYMSGLSAFYKEDFELALGRFQALLNKYPQSVYCSEASYHKGLMMLKRQESALGGLFLINQQVQEQKNEDLKKRFQDAINDFLYKSDIAFLRNYNEFIGESHTQKANVIEALCYKLWENKEYAEIQKIITQYKKVYGSLSPKLKKWVLDTVVVKKKNPLFRIATILPFQADLNVATVNSVASWGIEILEGMQTALFMNEESYQADIILKAFDSKNDVAITQKLLDNEVKKFKPDIIVGDVLNPICKTISTFAEEQKIIQFIPISPVESLIENKTFTYLFNSSMQSQINGLAKYATDKMMVKKVLILNDQTPLSDIQTKVFSDFMTKNKTAIQVRKVSLQNDYDSKRAAVLIGDLKENDIQGLFIASNNEKFVAAILNAMRNKNIHAYVFGSSDWGRFQTIDKKTLSYFNSTFVDGYYPDNDSANYAKFSKNYRETFKRFPSRYACLGHDFMSYLLNLKKINPTKSIKELLEEAKPFKGLIQNYYFSKAQDNQSIQVLQYRDGKIEKVKLW